MLLDADERCVLELLTSLRADEERLWRQYGLGHGGATLYGIAHILECDLPEADAALERLVASGIIERREKNCVSYKVIDYDQVDDLLRSGPPLIPLGPRLRVSPLGALGRLVRLVA